MPLRIVAAIAVVLLALAGGLYWWRQSNPPTLPAPAATAPAVASAAPRGPQFPLQPAGSEALPKLGESDPAIATALQTLLGADSFRKLLHVDDFVRSLVATVDNLPRKTYAARLNPVNPPGGLLRTTGKDATLAIAPENSARYTAYVRALEALDTAQAVDLYKRFYPLFQQAYVDLGYPDGYFNDRLMEALENLLGTPDMKGPLKLVQPHVLYEFADDSLEDLSAGQKTLLRMGPENAARVKAKVVEIRRALATPKAPS